MKQLALRILIVSVALSAVMGIYALLAGDFGDTEMRILFTTLCVGGASILAMACAPAWERRRMGVLPLAGVVMSVGCAAAFILGIWTEIDSDEFWKTSLSVGLLGIAAAHACLMALAKLAARHRWVQVSAYVIAFVLAWALIGMLWMDDPDEDLWRWIGVLAVLLAAATILVPVLQRMAGADETQAGGHRVRHCPACGASLDHAPGRAECSQCGTGFRVEFD